MRSISGTKLLRRARSLQRSPPPVLKISTRPAPTPRSSSAGASSSMRASTAVPGGKAARELDTSGGTASASGRQGAGRRGPSAAGASTARRSGEPGARRRRRPRGAPARAAGCRPVAAADSSFSLRKAGLPRPAEKEGQPRPRPDALLQGGQGRRRSVPARRRGRSRRPPPTSAGCASWGCGSSAARGRRKRRRALQRRAQVEPRIGRRCRRADE